MKALITGASSGIGRDMARILARRGCELILTARRRDRLEELQKELSVPVTILCADLSREKDCFELYRQVRNENVDIVINNAGFGVFGPFDETNLQRELSMLDVNIRALHILTKLFLRDFKKRNFGYILNVSSSAAFLPGPLLSSYYASKAYVLRLTQAIQEELRHSHSRVYVGAFCPGPVSTEFDRVANVEFTVKNISSQRAAAVAIQQMFRRQPLIITGTDMKASKVLVRLIPDKLLLRISYHLQKRKQGTEVPNRKGGSRPHPKGSVNHG